MKVAPPRSLLLLVALAAPTVVLADAPRPPSAAPAEPSSATAELRKQQELLTLENSIADARLRKELFALTAEKQRRELESQVAQGRLQAEIASLQAEADRLGKQLDLVNRRNALKEAERRARLDGETGEVRVKLERARLNNELAAAELAGKKREMEQREAELRLRVTEMQVQRSEVEVQLAKLNAEIDLREKRDAWKNRVSTEIHYAANPFANGVLTISDRRIALNGPIMADTADRIADRVQYFNNQNRKLPIFIVIDSSPGGSVAAGYKILKTMHGSTAPVFVVVKSFAASMAACITTLAARSFAYPNAILLHHQMSSFSMGNMTELREQQREREEWWQRLAAPVAKKMGIGLDEFVKRMYQNRSSGDWREFGDGARKIKWVDEVVEDIREESIIKNPDAPVPLHFPFPSAPQPIRVEVQGQPVASSRAPLAEQVDEHGRHFVALPRLDPVDAYYLYNPDGYYRPLR